MAQKTKATAQKAAKNDTRTEKKSLKKSHAEMMGLPLQTWVSTARICKASEVRSGRRGFLFVFAQRDNKALKSALSDHLSKWQMELLLESESESTQLQGSQGPVWVICVPQISNKEAAQQSSRSLEKSDYARVRDLCGPVVPQLLPFKLDKLIIELHDLSEDEEKAVLIGLEMASYSYSENRPSSPKKRKKLPELLFKTTSEEFTPALILEAANLALSINLARHFVNIPGGELNPRTYADSVVELFASSRTVKVDVWERERLKRENMNLLLAVGGAASESPRLVHIRYRPTQKVNGLKPVALVGKGITFDSGGLDIKPSSGMRWMKKDMGGSAAAVALAKWAEVTELPLPLDIYLSLAENAISGSAFRPGDVVTSRSGLTIEIHNTDAEGRLALADALDVAVTQKGSDEPSAVINLATLTGAIKVGLGAEIAGLFSNNDDLAELIAEAGLLRGDLCWRMPLYQPYRHSFRSTFADYANASDGFGGAITAALFLELFVKNKPWAHLDIFAWKDLAGGAYAEAGGNGQPVQALTEVLTRLASDTQADRRA